MTGFVLAAGFGTRLRPITDHVPKALVPVCGVPALERHLRRLHEAGIARLAANVHHLPDQMDAFAARSSVAPRLFHERGDIRGTGGALDSARAFLAGDDTFCVCNVDIFCDADLAGLARRFVDSGADSTLVAAPPRGRGTVLFDPASGGYAGTPLDSGGTEGLVGADYIGLAFYRRSFLSCVRDDDFSVVPVWRRAVERGLAVTVSVEPDLAWYDIGTPQAFARIHFDVAAGRFPMTVPPDMVVERERRRACRRELPSDTVDRLGPEVWAESTHIDPRARLERTVVFRNATVGPSSLTDAIVTEWGEVRWGSEA